MNALLSMTDISVRLGGGETVRESQAAIGACPELTG